MLTQLIMVVIIASAAHLIKRKWQNLDNRTSTQEHKRTSISRVDALAILGLEEPFTEEDVLAAHRRLITRVHPDKGGTVFLAQQLNTARDQLLIEYKNKNF